MQQYDNVVGQFSCRKIDSKCFWYEVLHQRSYLMKKERRKRREKRSLKVREEGKEI